MFSMMEEFRILSTPVVTMVVHRIAPTSIMTEAPIQPVTIMAVVPIPLVTMVEEVIGDATEKGSSTPRRLDGEGLLIL
jgi:hypothetical protein